MLPPQEEKGIIKSILSNHKMKVSLILHVDVVCAPLALRAWARACAMACGVCAWLSVGLFTPFSVCRLEAITMSSMLNGGVCGKIMLSSTKMV